MATIACSMPASVYSRVARKREFSTLSLRSAVENGSFSTPLTGMKGCTVDRGCTPAPKDATKTGGVLSLFSRLSLDFSIKNSMQR